MTNFLVQHGAMQAVLPAGRRISACPGRTMDDGGFRFAFEDGEERAVRHFAWFDEAHIVYIEGTDVIERYGRHFWVLRCEAYQEAHDRFYEVMKALEDGA